MRANNKLNARKKKVNGILFDSIYESEVYLQLVDRFPGSAKYYIAPHRAISILPECSQRQPKKNTSWRVDFEVREDNNPLFYLEAKGRFHETDGYKFLLWNLYQTLPLLVVHSSPLSKALQSAGKVVFIDHDRFRFMSRKDILDCVQSIAQ